MKRQGKAGQAREKVGSSEKNQASKEDSAGETARVSRAGEGTVAVAATCQRVSVSITTSSSSTARTGGFCHHKLGLIHLPHR